MDIFIWKPIVPKSRETILQHLTKYIKSMNLFY